MKIVLFSLFGINVYSHGVFLTLSMIIGGWLLWRLAQKEKLETKNYFSNYIASLIVGIIASRVLFYLINLKYYQNFWQLLEIWQGGLVSFAGFIAGGLTFVLLLHYQKEKIAPWLDVAGVVFPLAIAIGRIGCALNGEFGIKTKSIFAIYGFMPVTVFEIFLCMAIFAINFYIYLHFRKKLISYFLFFNFLVLYSLGRIFIDAYRIDRSLIVGVNLSQLTSLIILLLSIFIFGLHYLKESRGEHDES